MIRHRFINDGISPIPMGPTARYTCICGRTGTRESIERHIATESARDAAPVEISSGAVRGVAEDYSGGDTKVNYLPGAPRKPAPTKESPPLQRPDRAMTPEPLPPPPPEPKVMPSIAELFQNMLRISYEAGVASATTGETFETWYQREVLR